MEEVEEVVDLPEPSNEELVQWANEELQSWEYWVNEDNTVATRRKGDWPHPGEGWYEVDENGFDFVVSQIDETIRSNMAKRQEAEKQGKIDRLVEAGLDRAVAVILVEG